MTPPPALLSRQEKDRIIARAFQGLYRWYLARSQKHRNWNPDLSFDWRCFRRDHSPEVIAILQGFYAVEQYVPDYTSELTRLVRKNYGRAQFHVRWGAEEQKHADLWQNALLFSRRRNRAWLEQYTTDLRASRWELPWDDPIRMLLYTVLQERATELNYLNLARIARGQSEKPWLANDRDPVLEKAAAMIAADEAAHYNFFLEGARLYLHFYPRETLEALVDVFRHFAMPAMRIIPDYDAFLTALYAADVFNGRIYVRDVVRHALDKLGVAAIRQIESGIRRGRQAPDADGVLRDTTAIDGLDAGIVEASVERLFARIASFEREVGLDEVQ
jgi:acyl-[acyl-carrier-protein] desaturase